MVYTLAKNYSTEIEQKWQKKWDEDKTYAFSESGSKPIYSIDSPPPFTSGELHMGHVLSYSFFDFVARYKRMRGFNVFYPQGWDTQGFPTETKVEKKYGKLPPIEFRQKCVEWTYEFIARMKSQMISMGFSPDWRYEYRTMEPEYHRKVQLSLIKMYSAGEVYMAEYPVHWCPSCVSAIAKAETEDLERETLFNYVNFTSPEGELQIATTRPELIPACVALLFNPEDARYTHLAGKKAKTPLGEEVPILADKDVEKDFGTGLMMVCTFGDKMDVVWAHRYKLPFKNLINKYGKFENAGELNGLKVEAARVKILEKLKAQGSLVKQEKKPQVVKVHDRCKTPVEFISSLQWFAAIKKAAPRIKDFASKIEWVPPFGITYLTDWVDNVDWDWVISRQRIFGTPLPFYVCPNCRRTEAAKESELPFYPEKAQKRKCSCGSDMAPEASTADCWVDSSITPLIIAGWPDEEKMKKLYPSSLRPQGVEIVRTWAFYTIYRSGTLTGAAPFKTILLNGNVLAPDGKKMSKSLGNVISPQTLLTEYNADSIRQWAALSGAMAKDRPFSYEDIRYAKSFLNKLWNSAKLVEIGLQGYEGGEGKLRAVDKWIISRMNETIKDFTAHMEVFEFHYAMNKLHDFYWHDFCDNYLEYVKHRIYDAQHGEESRAAQHSMRYVLLNTLKLIAPISPHISEEIWNELFEKKSIHLSEWPSAGPIDSEAVKKAEVANEIVKLLRQHKASNKKPMNSPILRAS
ncbi:MAG: valine--tRNA ligase, partial [Candidatus ainarchaeum sp.]|nr:valine--tRNA ligase [Candidatus ainarchaeum sp.]